MLKKERIIFLTYGGYFTQPLIVAMTETLEEESQRASLPSSLAHKIFVIFIELSQNLMNYSKNMKSLFDPKGIITVGKNDKEGYYIFSQNIVTKEDREKIEKTLSLIKSITKEEIRKIYRQRRKDGLYAHEKGGGIGFFEIAKRANQINYTFEPIDEEREFFKFKAIVGEN
ncbi:MAG: hypothetical protein GXO62_01805 [Epsilonproteobacteria bacterium]|nr:hypothetical protein [Campylobacterota bacterium]